MLTVTVNDRPLDVAAIVERGRVLLPMRATFTALGAAVRYDRAGRVIVARNAHHALRLQIGSKNALVDGRNVRLDVSARVIANRTYVPLRFVADAMGAVVGYDARANVVSVNAAVQHPASAAARGANVVALAPPPESVVASAYPTISASLAAANASRSAVTLTLDGQDVTAQSTFDGATITYMPRIGLMQGRHNVVFTGRTLANDTFSTSWSFNTSLQAPPDAPALSAYDYRFYASGATAYYPGDWMHFVLIAPPGGSAELQLCGLGFQYALWNTGYDSVYEANFPAPNGYWMPACTVTATYTAWNGQQYYVPLPLVIGLFTAPNGARPTPKPTFAPRPIPIEPRRPEPTPVPAPTRRPLPIATHVPAPPTAAPKPAPPRPEPKPRPEHTPHPVPRDTP